MDSDWRRTHRALHAVQADRQGRLEIDGRIIKHILPTCLTVNRAGVIGYEAVAGNANQIAVFVGNKFGAALSKGGESNDFILADDNQVILQGAHRRFRPDADGQ